MSDYEAFLDRRQPLPDAGFHVVDVNPQLFPFQQEIVRWALARGRAAIFADCGLGKTPMQLEWARHVTAETGGDVLIVAPLAVAQQTRREGDKFGVSVNVCRVEGDLRGGVNVVNYDRLHRFQGHDWAGVVLDESSILKAFDGKTRSELTEWGRSVPLRLCCTATPSPNDFEELGGHSEFLGVLNRRQMLAEFFINDGIAASNWRLKGHARRAFWLWVASWARALRSPADLGFDADEFDLPPLSVETVSVDADAVSEDRLFPVPVSTLTERRQARRESISHRVEIAAEIVNGSDQPWVVWCDLNDESRQLATAIPDALEVRGSDDSDVKESRLAAFSEGEARVMVSKPSIAGWGLNWQHCPNVLFVGLSDSYEQYYQAVRRCWRFGQESPVRVIIVASSREQTVLENVRRKERNAVDMFNEVVEAMREAQSQRARGVYVEDEETGDRWALKLGDCIERVREIADESVGLTVFSPPFPGMYVYSDSERDMGNAASLEELMTHYRFLAPELLRVTKPGRSCCVHLCQMVTVKSMDGYSGLRDFRGETIKAMQDAGWIYYGEVAIDKDPQLKAIRTKDHGLLFKTLANDSAKMHMALADYMLQFRKPGENEEPIRAGISDRYGNADGWITPEEWIEWAAPVWYRASEHYPGGIRETDVLNAAVARDNADERHIAPLQLGVIERAVKLWSNPGDLVLSPFAGIGSEGYVALKQGRRFVGVELKRSYYDTAIRNLREAEGQLSLLTA